MYGDLKVISNHQMMAGTIINVAQNIICLQHQNIAVLQDTLLGQSFHSQDAKGQISFLFKELPDKPFVQALHDGNVQWLAVSTINCLPDEISIMEVCLGKKLTIICKGKYVQSCIAAWALSKPPYSHYNNKQMVLIVASIF